MNRVRTPPHLSVHRTRMEALRGLGFPQLTDLERLQLFRRPSRPARVVIDTDTYNEVDDQFAIAYALLSSQHLRVEAVYAAPFTNERAAGPAEGMAKSFDEIVRLLKLLGRHHRDLPVHNGSEAYLGPGLQPQRNAAVLDLVERAMASTPDDPLTVIGLAVPTNIASALLLEPRIIRNIVVVWLGGHALSWPDTDEFNLRQDVPASRLLLDCGVALRLVPCNGVARLLNVSVADLERDVQAAGPLGAYLTECVRGYSDDHVGWSKPLWDVAAVAGLINNEWAPADLVHSPVLTDDVTWSVDPARHLVECTRFVNRNRIIGDLFRKLREASP